MQIPDPVTLKWLKAAMPGRSSLNAHWVAERHGTSPIPRELMSEFLAITNSDGTTTLHALCLTRPVTEIQQLGVLLSNDALMRAEKVTNSTPFSILLYAGKGTAVPWERLGARKWLKMLPMLRLIQQKYGHASYEYQRLAEFIARIEALDSLKKKHKEPES